jgi:hypothetical protein
MSYFLPRLESGWHVDQAILAEDNRVVVIRYGHDWVSLVCVLARGRNACPWAEDDSKLRWCGTNRSIAGERRSNLAVAVNGS